MADGYRVAGLATPCATYAEAGSYVGTGTAGTPGLVVQYEGALNGEAAVSRQGLVAATAVNGV